MVLVPDRQLLRTLVATGGLHSPINPGGRSCDWWQRKRIRVGPA